MNGADGDATTSMRKFGLIGGTSWHSTVAYYATINRLINAHHGDNTNPPLRIVSLNQRQIHDLQRAERWDAIADIYTAAAQELQRLDVSAMALCANTPHKLYDQLSSAVSCPILHIADAIAAKLKQDRQTTVGLLGTRFTMSQGFIKDRLRERHGIDTIVPASPDQAEMQTRIYNELVVGRFDDATKTWCLGLVEALAANGAQAVILGCTELPLLMQDSRSPIPTVDSVACHCQAIADYLLQTSAAT